MFKNYLKISIRNLHKNKAFSLINIVGFAFGISICLGIAAFLLHEYSFDHYHGDSDRIYRLTDAQNNSSSIDYRVKDILVSNYPEIENACLFQLLSYPMPVTVNNRGIYVESLLSTENAFFKMFAIPILFGNKDQPLPDQYSVVLTESAAKKLFGDENPMGKNIELRHRFPLTVTGIIQDFPDNSSIQAQMIVNAKNDDFKFSFSCERGDDKSTYRWPFRIYLLLNKNTNKNAFIDIINSHPELLHPYEKKIGLLSLRDMYLYDRTQGSFTKQGNPGLLKLMLSIGLTILILAVINYINLTAAQQHKRYKEIGVRKSMGADKRDILLQFLSESIWVAFISFLIAIVILSYCIPIYQSIFYDTFQVHPLLDNWYVILPIVFLLGIISGCGSAFFFSSIHPIQALKGEIFTKRIKFSWRNGLTVFQFLVSIALIFCIIVMQKQIHYLKHRQPGFEEEQLLKLDMPQIQQADKNDVFLLLDQYRQYPGIMSVSMTNGIPGRINTWMGANMPGKNKSVPIIYADSSFLKTFGIKVIQGRNPVPGDYGTTCLFNEAAYQYFEWTDLKDKRYNNGRKGGFEVIGVVNNFQIFSLRSAIEPLCILFHEEIYPTHLSIRIATGTIGETLQFIQKKWQQILPQYPLQYEFYDSWLDAMYRQDEKIGKAIGLFAALAIVISCLGILGMAIFSTQKRTKEIGIRKVIGASIQNILVMLTKHYTLWVLFANIFAWPIGWYAMNRWLQNFTYRIEMNWWMFALASGSALLIALLTVSWQAVRAARANPVESLRYE